MSSPAPPSPRRNRLYLSLFKARSKYGPRRLLGSSISFGVKYVVVAVSSSERQATSCETICGCSVRIAHPDRSTAIPPALRRRPRPARSSGTSLPPSPLSTNQFTTVATSAEASEAESTFCIVTPRQPQSCRRSYNRGVTEGEAPALEDNQPATTAVGISRRQVPNPDSKHPRRRI